MSDHTIYAWGGNEHGQLGNGASAASNTPVAVSGLTGAVAVAGGRDYSLSLDSEGTVWAWGNNQYGQLGDGDAGSRNSPLRITGLRDVVAVAGGWSHALAVKSDGTVWAWGLTYRSALEDSAAGSGPIQVRGLTGVVAVSAGYEFSLALKGDGTVWAWGGNDSGQLGNGLTQRSAVPVPVSGLTGVVAIAAGYDHGLALRSDGTVLGWGSANYGQVGNGSFERYLTVPVPMNDLTGVVGIAAGSSLSLALKGDGTVWNWGGYFFGFKPVPAQVSGVTGVVAIAGGNHDMVALKRDGTVWSWGTNYFGQLGNGTNADTTEPAKVSDLSGVAAIGAGQVHNLAILGGGIPEIAVSPATLLFEANGAQTITVSNRGAAPLTIRRIILTGINPGDFTTLDACSAASLAVSQSCTVKVTFAPFLPRNRTAGLLIIANAPGSPIWVPLSGSGTASSCASSLSPTTLIAQSTGGTFPIKIQAESACPWNPSGLPGWISAEPGNGNGYGTIALTVAANPGLSRSAVVLIAGVPVAIAQPAVLSINAGGVVNAASYTSPVAPGSIVSIFGNFLTGSPLPELSVQMSDEQAPLLFGSGGQVIAQVPWELKKISQGPVFATLYGQTSKFEAIGVAPYAPGIFATNGQGTGQGAILDTIYRLVDAANPASAGSTVVQIYGTGLGGVTNQPATGAPAPSHPLAATVTTPIVTIGGAPATVLFSGLAPGLIGVYQVNAVVPLASVKGSAVPVTIAIAGVASNTVTMPVR